eukprot:1182896-Prorocentrum_minimum.AAC.4
MKKSMQCPISCINIAWAAHHSSVWHQQLLNTSIPMTICTSRATAREFRALHGGGGGANHTERPPPQHPYYCASRGFKPPP